MTDASRTPAAARGDCVVLVNPPCPLFCRLRLECDSSMLRCQRHLHVFDRLGLKPPGPEMEWDHGLCLKVGFTTLTSMRSIQVYDDVDEVKLNDVCEFVGVLSRVSGLAAAQLEAQRSGDGAEGGSDEDGPGRGTCTSDELAMDEALAMPPTSLVRPLC